ncbi:MAG: glycine cleavage system protein GcvH [Gemmatimonadales bacterium]|nr:glycine cleavage system protein GcvH [Gemmatimonadales bacterium]
MEFPSDLRYTADHEWLRAEGAEAVVGITAFAVDQLGDVVYVDLPQPGTRLFAGAPFGTVESVKSVSELVAPVDGEVVGVNAGLADHPELVNQACYGEGWMLRIRPADPAQAAALKSADEYRALVGG